MKRQLIIPTILVVLLLSGCEPYNGNYIVELLEDSKTIDNYYICQFAWEGEKIDNWHYDIGIYSWYIYEYTPWSGQIIISTWVFAVYNHFCYKREWWEYEEIAIEFRCNAVQWDSKECVTRQREY